MVDDADLSALGGLKRMEHQDTLGDDEDVGDQVYMTKDAVEERQMQREEEEKNAGGGAADDDPNSRDKPFVSVPELQATMWTQSEFLRHFVTVWIATCFSVFRTLTAFMSFESIFQCVFSSDFDGFLIFGPGQCVNSNTVSRFIMFC